MTVYRCENERRRAAVAEHASLNGIDYLEVLDHEAPAGIAPQRTLVVRFLKPIPALTEANVVLDGGERIVVGVTWAARADTPPPDASAEDLAYLASFGVTADRALVVRTDSFGDYSTYRLRVVSSPVDPAPSPGIDPALAAVSFSFKVDCPSPFDCADDPRCPVHGDTVPPIDYLVKDYEGFRRLMLDRVSALLPTWRDRNPADLGVALIEMLAAVADQISYAQDAVGTEAYLHTARLRTSARRHARLLDYRVGEGCNARAWLCLEVSGDADGDTLADGTRILSRAAGPTAPRTIAPDDLDEVLAREKPVVFETMQPLAMRAAHNRIEIHTWSDADCCLPAGATRATVRRPPGFALAPGDPIILEEEIGVATGLPADADPTRRHAVVLTQVQTMRGGAPMADPLDGAPIAEIEWGADDALPFPLRVSAPVPTEAGGLVERPVAVVRGNVVLADHGLRIEREFLFPPEAAESGPYRPQLLRPNVTYASATDLSSASRAKASDPRRAEPVVELEDEGGARWRPVPDLIASDRFASEFVVEQGDDGVAHLRFGDDANGRAPSGGLEFRASYRVGSGTAGNVGAETLGRIVRAGSGVDLVRNPMPARGGEDPEPMPLVKLMAPAAFRGQERAVTRADEVEMAERYPGVQKAAARLRWTGSWHTSFVGVDRLGGGAVDRSTKEAVERHLDRFRMAGRDVHVDGARPVSLDIALTVCPRADVIAADLMRALLERLGPNDLPDGTRGFFHPDNFTFGESVYLSQIFEAVTREPGVAWVEATRFQRWGRDAAGEIDAGVLGVGALEIVRCQNDPSFPERGRLELTMVGGR